MAECKNCGRFECDRFNGHWDLRRWADDSDNADCIAHTVDWYARAKSLEAKLAAVQLAVEEIDVAYWDEDVSMLHYIEKALKETK